MFEHDLYQREPFEERVFEDEKTLAQKFDIQALNSRPELMRASAPESRTPDDPKQRRLMLAALALLLVGLCFALYHDRDFWFPEAQNAELEEPAETAPAAAAAPVAAAPSPESASLPSPAAPSASPAASSGPSASASVPALVVESSPHAAARRHEGMRARSAMATPVPAAEAPEPPPAVVSNRTALPPLNVEVVAGDHHRTIRPGTNSIRVDLQPGANPQSLHQPAIEVPSPVTAPTDAAETAANLSSNAAERVQMSADTQEAVSLPVKPGYPLLARQMKVQGSVILRALIGKEGEIQDLHVVSGPRILAAAAEDAVRQWHFKPHYVADEAVETQAKITVNFTISTN